MEEIEIEIDCLKNKKSETELSIVKPTEYGRWPSDEDFSMIGDKCRELKIITAQIEVLESVKQAVLSNSKSV